MVILERTGVLTKVVHTKLEIVSNTNTIIYIKLYITMLLNFI